MSARTSEALVSGALENELLQKVRARGLVLWLDAEGAFTGFVDRRLDSGLLPGVLAYRGSFLELMLALEPLTSGTDRPGLVVHLPGLRPEDVTRSPLLELWRAGVLYERRVDSLIGLAANGRATPDAIDTFVATRPTLEEADAWLERIAAESSAGIKSQLRTLGLIGFVDDLVRRGPLSERMADALERTATFEQVEAWIGLHAAWREATFDERAPRIDAMLYAIASFAMAVEYVFDLRRPPYSASLRPVTSLSVPLRDACRNLCVHLRERHAELYQRIADQTEADLPEEIEHAVATDLGKVDTFRFEEDKVLAYALEALDALAYDEALALAETRASPPDETSSFWTRRPDRRAAWLVVRDAARLGLAIEQAPPTLAEVAKSSGSDGLARLVEVYVAHGAAVDRAHRQLEQRRITSLFPEVPYFEKIRRCADGMRLAWLDWAERWALQTAKVSRTHGFLPPRHLLQRTVFDDVVLPLIRDARNSPIKGTKGPTEQPTVLFVVDALRFEMIEDLFREMEAVPHTNA
ncbi:MAG: BREX-6 system phosphatase PglZ, partial [Deltaproteobacteria bacterium]|nr:BREX-6 system phosphatase PglZ [Deltaproteobacteria bacterium]